MGCITKDWRNLSCREGLLQQGQATSELISTFISTSPTGRSSLTNEQKRSYSSLSYSIVCPCPQVPFAATPPVIITLGRWGGGELMGRGGFQRGWWARNGFGWRGRGAPSVWGRGRRRGRRGPATRRCQTTYTHESAAMPACTVQDLVLTLLKAAPAAMEAGDQVVVMAL